MSERHKVVILGGGFAGLYAALELEKGLSKHANVDVTLVNRENFFLFTPMLHEVAAGDLDPINIVNPVRKLLRRVSFYEAKAVKIDLHGKTVTIQHGFDEHTHELNYDQIILALGSTTQFFDLPGVGRTCPNDEKPYRCGQTQGSSDRCSRRDGYKMCWSDRRKLLSVIVAGAGFAGVETLASINDFLRRSIQFYRNLSEHDLRLTLNISGFLAWWMWRTIYLSKLPRLEKSFVSPGIGR